MIVNCIDKLIKGQIDQFAMYIQLNFKIARVLRYYEIDLSCTTALQTIRMFWVKSNSPELTKQK